MGSWLGRHAAKILHKRRRVAEINVRICFPELDDAGVNRIVRGSFESLGIALFEICLTWWGSAARIEKLVTIKGLDNVRNALKDGHGVVLVTGHFLAQEVASRPLVAEASGIAGLFRPGHNAFVNEILLRSRGSIARRMIGKEDMRLMIRTLREGMVVWYASDQSYRRKGSALVPFFGEPAMTSLALSDIARLGRARVLPFFPLRLANGSGYLVDIQPALENFPSDDPKADALRIHHLLEERIRLAPEQYYWVHRRFKNRGEGYPDPYQDI
jgi:KDO2-lipid IV(A) lauroyltransferase